MYIISHQPPAPSLRILSNNYVRLPGFIRQIKGEALSSTTFNWTNAPTARKQHQRLEQGEVQEVPHITPLSLLRWILREQIFLAPSNGTEERMKKL